MHLPRGPQRIVCLTEESTETLYLLGEQERIVGISAYTVRPPEAKRDKPVVSAFVGGSVEKICALKPDLVIGFSDIQAELAKDLIAANLSVLIFNQRSLQEIFDVIDALGRLVHRQEAATALIQKCQAHLDQVAAQSAQRVAKPRVYFEEWDDPMITGIRWVSELIAIAGGDDIFAERSEGKLAKERFVSTAEVEAADPEVVFASWCGKPFDRRAFEKRANFRKLSAVKNRRIVEVPAEIILQPGPAAVTAGLDFLHEHLSQSSSPQS